MDERTKLLLTSKPLPLLLKMATPNSIAFFVQSGVSMTEVWFIGQLGTVSLAAIALVFPLLMLTQMMSGGAFGGAIASAIARAYGAGDKERAERLIWHALALGGGGAATFLVLYLLLGKYFLTFLGGSGEVLAQASNYCLVLFSGGLALWLMGVTSAIYRGFGNMKLPAMMMMSGAVVQVPLSGCLVLGYMGFPQLGIAGAAISAIVTGTLISTIMLVRLAKGRETLKLANRRMQFSKALFKDILKVAMPASLSPLLTVTTIVSLTAIVGRYGAEALAGYGIGSRIEFLLVPLVFGLGSAMTSLVGMSIGAGNIDRAEHIGWIGGSSAAVVAGSIGVVLALFPDAWLSVFTTNPETYGAARQYIQLVGPCFAFQGLGLSLYFASQGAGAMFWPIAATILRIVLAVGGALALTAWTDLGLRGVYFAAGFGMVAFGIVIALSLKLGAWRR